jgi:hypothetical protein
MFLRHAFEFAATFTATSFGERQTVASLRSQLGELAWVISREHLRLMARSQRWAIWSSLWLPLREYSMMRYPPAAFEEYAQCRLSRFNYREIADVISSAHFLAAPFNQNQKH